MDSPTLRLDPNPCRLYRWTRGSVCTTHSGAHVCEYPGGHDGACRCDFCRKSGRGKDIAEVVQTVTFHVRPNLKDCDGAPA